MMQTNIATILCTTFYVQHHQRDVL